MSLNRYERQEACCWRCCYLIAKHINTIRCGIDGEDTEPNCVCDEFATDFDETKDLTGRDDGRRIFNI